MRFLCCLAFAICLAVVAANAQQPVKKSSEEREIVLRAQRLAVTRFQSTPITAELRFSSSSEVSDLQRTAGTLMKMDPENLRFFRNSDGQEILNSEHIKQLTADDVLLITEGENYEGSATM